MKIHEYQGRQLIQQAGIPVPAGTTVDNVDQAVAAFKAAVGTGAGGMAVVKAQVHAGGRGKAGFVKLVKTAAEAEEAVRFMLANRMRSPQTPPEGLEVRKILVAQAAEIAERAASAGKAAGREEFYLAVTTDRKTRRNILIASREGGVEIEQIAHDRPEAIIKEPLHPIAGLLPNQARKVAFELGMKGKQIGQAADIMVKLARVYVEKDCTLAHLQTMVKILQSTLKCFVKVQQFDCVVI